MFRYLIPLSSDEIRQRPHGHRRCFADRTIGTVSCADSWSRTRTPYCCGSKKLRLEKPRIKREWRDRCNCYPITARVTVINQHIAIGRAGDRHDDRRDQKDKLVALIEPCIPELLRVGLARGPVARQIAKRYVMRRRN